MPYRRFRHQLRQQNWVTIGMNLVVVVLGVFIGIQAANWNDSRREMRRGDQYLARISTDLEVDIAAMDHRMAFWREVVVHGEGAIGYAETGEHIDDSAWKTALSFFQASQLYPYVARDTTYQEMRNAGELGLVRDAALRTALADYYISGPSFQAGFLLRYEPEYRRIVRGLTPQAVSAHVWAHCHENVEDAHGGQRLLDCESPVTEAEAQRILDGYVADPRLLAELRFWTTNLDNSTTLLRVNREAAQALSARLDGKAGR